ncbi:Uncharacterized protein SCF082_LOCUS15817 [Durusdinium trenchii]
MGNVGARSQCCSGDHLGEANDPEPPEITRGGLNDLSLSKSSSKLKPQEDPVESHRSSQDFDRARRRTRTWVQDVPSSVRSFLVKVTKPLGKEKSAKLGLDIDYAEESTAIPVVDVNGGLMGQWNDENPMQLVRSGDCIVAVNGISKDVPNMLKSLMNVGQLELLVIRGTTDENGTEPVASGLLAAEGYYQQVEAQQIAAVTGNHETAPKAPTLGASTSVEPSSDQLARELARKRTLNWFVRG